MATQTQQWIPLEEIVTAYIDSSEQSPNKYMKLYNIAYRGMQVCGLDAFYQVKTIPLPVNANQTVNLPEDYQQYTKVGVLNSAGEVTTLKRNENIAKLKPYHTDRSEGVATLNADSCDFYNYWQNGSCYNICGLPACTSTSYTVDEKEGLLFLNNINSTSIVLEYVASPNPDEDYKVPVQFSEALIAFLGWQDIMYVPSSRRGNLGDKRDRKNNFYNERRLAIARYKPIRLREFYSK
jgi:hypothetical protein